MPIITKGFSLIELMVALFISFLLLAIMFKAIELVNASGDTQVGFSNMELNALQVMVALKKQIVYAGFMGCYDLNQNKAILNHTGLTSDTVSRSQALNIQKNSITILRVAQLERLSASMDDRTSLVVRALGGFKKKSVVVVGDCQSIEVDRIASIRKVRGQNLYRILLTKPLSVKYNATATIALLLRFHYFLKPVSYDRNITALFVEDINRRNHELVPYLTRLRFDSYKEKAVIVYFSVVDPKERLSSKWQYVIPILKNH